VGSRTDGSRLKRCLAVQPPLEPSSGPRRQ
jgi:hypothetical protein